jgi:hypothetical protein
METPAQLAPGYYVWEMPGKPIAVHLHLNVVDRLLAEVMRGFGAVPKRGAEVGGVLIGCVEPGDPSIVRIDDYEVIKCDYKFGPSYLFEDLAPFEGPCGRWAKDESRPTYAVGYFRSHTRDGFSLAAEDITLLDRFFPEPWNIALLVRPYGSKVSTAGFFFRENGEFQKSTPLEFPFRLRELTGGETPLRRSLNDRQPREREARQPTPVPLSEEEPAQGSAQAVPWWPQPSLPDPGMRSSRSRVRGWVWIPLSFIFLLLGVLLGLQTALSTMSKAPKNAARDFSLGLSVARSGDNLSVRWDREAPAIRGAERGVLDIEDGGLTKSVELDPAHLESGSLIYRNSSSNVKFRLVVFPGAQLSVTETAEWKP